MMIILVMMYNFLDPICTGSSKGEKRRQAVLIKMTPDYRGKRESEWATLGLVVVALGVHNYFQQLNSVEIGVFVFLKSEFLST